MIPVKICGITNLSDALVCCSAGTAALGFVLAPSPRRVTPEQLAEITRKLPPLVIKVGVFVNEDPDLIREIMKDCQLDLAQLHGDEGPDDCEQLEGRVIKVFKAGKDLPSPEWNRCPLRGALIDSFSKQAAGGTGMTFDWNIFKEFRKLSIPLILAGGLTLGNLAEAVQTARPDAVDVSGGVEKAPGLKDLQKVQRFMKMARRCS